MNSFRDPKYYYVYIMSNRSKTLYTGVTNSVRRRVWQHKCQEGSEFTSRYKCDRLVYYERFVNVGRAIAREKQIKGWLRIRKISLIVSINPTWEDLCSGWYDAVPEIKPCNGSFASLRMTSTSKCIGPSLRSG